MNQKEKNLSLQHKKHNMLSSKKHIANKISLSTGVVLLIVLSILVSFTTVFTKINLEKSIKGEFQGVAAQNGIIIQSMFDEATNVIKNLCSYTQRTYSTDWGNDQFGDNTAQNIGENVQEGTSVASPKPFTTAVDGQKTNVRGNEIENFLLNQMWASMQNYDFIEGIGIFFEPKQFDGKLNDYSIYISKNDAENFTAQSYGAYSDFSEYQFYKNPKESLKSHLSEPYILDEESGTVVITVSYPIISDNQIKGVAMADVNISDFSKVKSSDEKYPSMYASIMTDVGNIIFDSSEQYLWTNIYDYLPNEKQIEKIKENASGTSNFDLQLLLKQNISQEEIDAGVKPKENEYLCFFNPIRIGDKIWWAQSSLSEFDFDKLPIFLSSCTIAISTVALIILLVFIASFVKKSLKPIIEIQNVANQ
ncbi:MAG: cache domain-containing protein, partial [Oscillospiraceae bacterium]